MSFIGNLLGTQDCIAQSIADYLVLEDMGLEHHIDIAMEFAELTCISAILDTIRRVIVHD